MDIESTRRRVGLAVCAVAMATLACGSTDRDQGFFSPTRPSGAEDGDGGVATGAAATGGDHDDASDGNADTGEAASTGGAGDVTDGVPGDPPDATTGGPAMEGLDAVGTLVVLGDSIGDGGGQGPFYPDLLRDALSAHYGAVQFVNVADSGSETGALLGQVEVLPSSLPGPVAVVITSGGNDMGDEIEAVVTGLDGPAKAQMQANIDAALGALLSPGRFGDGVDVFVFEGNIYDSSDGNGDFGLAGCPFGGDVPPIPSDSFFDGWNAAIRETVEANGQIAVDMHAHFFGHGYHANPSWYTSDCTHPNATGHDQLHRLFFEAITGVPAP